jgi:serine/threonine-protein kinase
MEGIFAVLLPVMIVFIVTQYRLRMKQLTIAEKNPLPPRPDPKLLEAQDSERKALEARIQNLEAIVCSVDFELNQRLNRVLAEQSVALKAAALPAGGTVAAEPVKRPAVSGHETTVQSYALGHLLPGQVVLGRYTIERELGRGGMGAVYLARDAKLDERVALKTISSAMCADPSEMVERFRMEVQAARKVTHANVIRIHDLGEDGAMLFLSMEYVEGETLYARVKRLGPLAIGDARRVLGEVASGVAAAHAAGVIHRDLKPQNVLIAGSSARVIKVIDFGLARTTFGAGMTATGLIMGTPEYMAPEQVRGQRSDARADVYALGAVAYYTLCGRPPFLGDTPIAVGFAQVHEAPRPLRELRPEIPAKLEEVVLRALAKEPAGRYRDANEWHDALEAS